MAENSKIEWTDHTFNPWRGCAHKQLADGTPHPGCENCYAEALSKRNPKTLGQWGEASGEKGEGSGVRVSGDDKYWKLPIKWSALAAHEGRVARVFCASLADVFEDWQGPIHDHNGQPLWRCRFHPNDPFPGPEHCDHHRAVCPHCAATGPHVLALDMGYLRARLFAIIDATPHLFWLLLTKRPENVRRMWSDLPLRQLPDATGPGVAHPGRWTQRRENVAIGTSVSDQATTDELVPHLLRCRDLAPVLFLSVEPLLGPIDLKPRPPDQRGACLIDHRHDGSQGPCQTQGIDWVIVGGESGHHARAMHPNWARDLRDQCTAAGVPFFFKQWGEWRPAVFDEGDGDLSYPSADDDRSVDPFGDAARVLRVGKHAAGRLLDGREWNELPRELLAVSGQPLAREEAAR